PMPSGARGSAGSVQAMRPSRTSTCACANGSFRSGDTTVTLRIQRARGAVVLGGPAGRAAQAIVVVRWSMRKALRRDMCTRIASANGHLTEIADGIRFLRETVCVADTWTSAVCVVALDGD